jgi:hypothetical protein
MWNDITVWRIYSSRAKQPHQEVHYCTFEYWLNDSNSGSLVPAAQHRSISQQKYLQKLGWTM